MDAAQGHLSKRRAGSWNRLPEAGLWRRPISSPESSDKPPYLVGHYLVLAAWKHCLTFDLLVRKRAGPIMTCIPPC